MLYENSCSDELLKILKNIQKNDLFKNYLLVGGTSLSLQLGHRFSNDIDLFTLDPQNNGIILEFLNDNYKNIDVINNREKILQVKVNGLKVDFVNAVGKLIKEPIVENGLILCHKEDIAGMKLKAINGVTGRKEAKDFMDIGYLILDLTLERMFDIYKWKYDKKDIYNVKIDLLQVHTINPYEWAEVKMIRNDITMFNIQKLIDDSLKEYNKTNITKKLDNPQ